MLIKLLEHEDSRSRNLSTLRSVRFGGAPMAADRIREAVGWWGPVFCSGWGQWEAPQQCTFFSQRQIAEAVSSHRSRLTSVGLPVAFARVAIADDAGDRKSTRLNSSH